MEATTPEHSPDSSAATGRTADGSQLGKSPVVRTGVQKDDAPMRRRHTFNDMLSVDTPQGLPLPVGNYRFTMRSRAGHRNGKK